VDLSSGLSNERKLYWVNVDSPKNSLNDEDGLIFVYGNTFLLGFPA